MNAGQDTAAEYLAEKVFHECGYDLDAALARLAGMPKTETRNSAVNVVTALASDNDHANDNGPETAE